jgi:hypothetical protein
MKNGILILAGALLLAPATPLAAQTITSHPATERGKHSLLLSLYSGPQIGYWVRQSDRTDFGLEVGGFGDFGDDSKQFGLTATPGLKHYHSSVGPLTPYTYVGVPISYMRSSVGESAVVSSFGAGGIFGLGLDWFPSSRVSIGGHAQLSAVFTDYDGPNHVISIRTATSGVRVHLYF